MKNSKKRILAVLLVSMGLLSYPNAFDYASKLSESTIVKMIKTFNSISNDNKSNLKNNEILCSGCVLSPKKMG